MISCILQGQGRTLLLEEKVENLLHLISGYPHIISQRNTNQSVANIGLEASFIPSARTGVTPSFKRQHVLCDSHMPTYNSL